MNRFKLSFGFYNMANLPPTFVIVVIYRRVLLRGSNGSRDDSCFVWCDEICYDM